MRTMIEATAEERAVLLVLGVLCIAVAFLAGYENLMHEPSWGVLWLGVAALLAGLVFLYAFVRTLL